MNAVEKKTVLITGASSGIGRACAARLLHAGWHVVASVRQSQHGDALRSEFGADLTPVIMDVTDRSTITAAAEQLRPELAGRGLDGLVNVAGIGMVRPVEHVTPEDLQEIFAINVFGQIAVTQAFLPMLRGARGRIINISSVGVNVAIPFGGLLNASKSALAKFSDTLRLEMRPFGIRVCAVEPGAIKTPAVEKTLGNIEAAVANLPPEGAARYGEMMRTFARRGYAQEMNGSPPEAVAEAVHHALTARRPRIRYRVGKHSHLLAALPKVLPEAILDRAMLRVAGMPAEFGALAAQGNRLDRKRAA